MRQIMMMIAAMFFTITTSAKGALVFDFVPSAQTTNINGIQFSPLGDRFIVTNTLVSQQLNAVSSLYIDFEVNYNHTDAVGNVFYTPNSTTYQLFVLDQKLTSPPGPTPGIIAEDSLPGLSEVFNLGQGRYEYKADTGSGSIDFVFNTNSPLGYQVESGTYTYNGNATPEPSSLAMLGIGATIAAVGRKFYRGRRV